MNSKHRALAFVSLGTLAAGLIIAPAVSQQASGPVARYTMDAATVSGMAAMASGGGGIGAAMSVLRGGGNQVAHELTLRLGSTRAPTGAPKGDHFMPANAGLGPSVPLETPARVVPGPATPQGLPQGTQMPQGRLLLFWGCGEHAPAGQPVVIDFAKMARGQVPPGLYAQALNLPDEWQITQANSRTYGDWPNSRETKRVPANASLLGPHRVASTYAPEIAFNLADDFMPALQASSRDMPSGAVGLSWNGLPKATGYYAWTIGTGGGDGRGESRDMVWWTSSATQAFGGPMSDWLSPAAAARLVAAKTVMPPTQTSCTIPAEVKQAGGPIMMTQLFAYGPEADFAYPPRPAAAAAARAWKPEWIARVRFKSSTMLMGGMPGLGGAGDDGDRRSAGAPPTSGKPKCRGLRGIAERAAGLCE